MDHTLVHQLTAVAKKKNHTPGQLILAWILAQGDDSIPIPGRWKIKNPEENAAATQVKLSKQEVEEIHQTCEKPDVAGGRYPEIMADHLFADSAAKKN